MTQEQTYFVKGMHCASCEVLIEKKILDLPGVTSAEASTEKGRVVFEYEGQKPDINQLNNLFKKDNYSFWDNPSHPQETLPPAPLNKTLLAFNIAIFIIIAFLFLDKSGLSSIFGVGSQSSLIAFLGFGLLAGISSCAALVGGIVLSMSKQWHQMYADDSSYIKKIQPHLLFNAGRILSYTILGGVLGLIGSRLAISLSFVSFLVIAISLLMIALALQMLGVKGFRKFQPSMPKFVTRYIANERHFKGKYMPFIMGAATFFLPCGFTITVQSLALLSGSWLQGGLMMGLFALGTAPMLLAIGFSSTAFFSKPHISITFSKVAGFLVLFFALFNIYNQLGVLGIGAIPQSQTASQDQSGLVPVVNGKQIMAMTVHAAKYSPNYFKVKANVPVAWQITSSGEPGCDTGAVISNILTDGPIYLNPQQGQTTTKEFTASTPGIYRFSCYMGMVKGTIEVVN